MITGFSLSAWSYIFKCKDILFDETAGTWWLIDIFVFYHVLGKLSNAIPGSWAPLVF